MDKNIYILCLLLVGVICDDRIINILVIDLIKCWVRFSLLDLWGLVEFLIVLIRVIRSGLSI